MRTLVERPLRRLRGPAANVAMVCSFLLAGAHQALGAPAADPLPCCYSYTAEKDSTDNPVDSPTMMLVRILVQVSAPFTNEAKDIKAVLNFPSSYKFSDSFSSGTTQCSSAPADLGDTAPTPATSRVQGFSCASQFNDFLSTTFKMQIPRAEVVPTNGTAGINATMIGVSVASSAASKTCARQLQCSAYPPFNPSIVNQSVGGIPVLALIIAGVVVAMLAVAATVFLVRRKARLAANYEMEASRRRTDLIDKMAVPMNPRGDPAAPAPSAAAAAGGVHEKPPGPAPASSVSPNLTRSKTSGAAAKGGIDAAAAPAARRPRSPTAEPRPRSMHLTQQNSAEGASHALAPITRKTTQESQQPPPYQAVGPTRSKEIQPVAASTTSMVDAGDDDDDDAPLVTAIAQRQQQQSMGSSFTQLPATDSAATLGPRVPSDLPLLPRSESTASTASSASGGGSSASSSGGATADTASPSRGQSRGHMVGRQDAPRVPRLNNMPTRKASVIDPARYSPNDPARPAPRAAPVPAGLNVPFLAGNARSGTPSPVPPPSPRIFSYPGDTSSMQAAPTPSPLTPSAATYQAGGGPLNAASSPGPGLHRSRSIARAEVADPDRMAAPALPSGGVPASQTTTTLSRSRSITRAEVADPDRMAVPAVPSGAASQQRQQQQQQGVARAGTLHRAKSNVTRIEVADPDRMAMPAPRVGAPSPGLSRSKTRGSERMAGNAEETFGTGAQHPPLP